MDLGDPWMLRSGMVIGLIGLMMLNMGGKETILQLLATSAAMPVYPYFIGSVLAP